VLRPAFQMGLKTAPLVQAALLALAIDVLGLFALKAQGATGITSGRFKKGVFGGDTVEVLIQHLLIEADQEGGYERCS